MTKHTFKVHAKSYIKTFIDGLDDSIIDEINELAHLLKEIWMIKAKVFICGNGGSAANAIHIANDLHYGTGACGEGEVINGLRVEALPANIGIVTCLANDIGYENVYSQQINVKGDQEDLLIVLSGSGNSPNILNAIEAANNIGMKSVAILAFGGGMCKGKATRSIVFETKDMQIAEDYQLMIGHLCMQWLNKNKKGEKL